MTTTTTISTPTIFQQYEQFTRCPQGFVPITMRYTIVSNTHGCIIADTGEWHELTICGATLFWPGVEGYDQAEQYIRETKPCEYCGSIVEVGVLHTPAGAVPCCFECIW